MYYHASTIYSIFALSNTDESVVERYRHTAYGETTVLDADGTEDADGASDVGNPYLFQSRRWEPAAGIMQFRHREYAPDLGRFLQRDPLGIFTRARIQKSKWGVGDADLLKLYQFANSSPIQSADPLGTSCHRWWEAEPEWPDCPKSEPEGNPDWCKEEYSPLHYGYVCYREVGRRYGSQQCCYAGDVVEESPDCINPVSAEEKGGDFCDYSPTWMIWHYYFDVEAKVPPKLCQECWDEMDLPPPAPGWM